MLEKDIERKLVKKVKSMGGTAYKWISPGHSGVPDRIVILPGGKIGFCELKRPGGNTTKLQDAQINKLSGLGCFVRVVYSMGGVTGFLHDLARGGDFGG